MASDDELWPGLAENYDAIVADENRNVSYEDIAKNAEELDDHRLAAWARQRAAERGKNVKPATAKAAPKSTRAKGKADE